jgi:glycosyltransferase involved in cell wall biosynthesis
MAANMITIQSNFGGNLDFMSEKNSYLVNGEKGRCPPNYQYWTPSRYAEMFIPNVDDAVDKLRYVVENLDKVKKDFEPHMKETVEQFTWGNVAKQILDLTE